MRRPSASMTSKRQAKVRQPEWNSTLDGFGQDVLSDVTVGDLIEITDTNADGYSKGCYHYQ